MPLTVKYKCWYCQKEVVRKVSLQEDGSYNVLRVICNCNEAIAVMLEMRIVEMEITGAVDEKGQADS